MHEHSGSLGTGSIVEKKNLTIIIFNFNKTLVVDVLRIFLISHSVILFIFNFFQDGTVQDLIERTFSGGGHIPELNILHMFKSLCDAILAFHSLDPPLAHRDIKVGTVCSNEQLTCWRGVLQFEQILLINSFGQNVAVPFLPGCGGRTP